MNGTIFEPQTPEASYFEFKKVSAEDGLDDADLFTVTWFFRTFAFYQPIPRRLQAWSSQRTIDVADRFINLWICFNSILRKHYGEDKSDGAMIRLAKADFAQAGGIIHLKEYYDTMLDNEFRNNLEELRRLLPITNMKNGRQLDLTNSSLVEIVYQIRCNLFHGRKNPEDKDNRDFQLVRLAFLLLAPIVIEYARQNGFIHTCVPRAFTISDLEEGICFV